MLRRRILASAMASVMALGSVAVVANAEETAAATTQVKTKADLEAYVKSFDKFRDDGLYDYGSVSGEKFLAALEYAENVIDASASTVDDYTVAYSMLEAVYNKLAIRTAEELKTLVNKCKAAYDTENIYNADLSDPVYVEENGSNTAIHKYGWNYFVEAYDEAESVLSSADSRIITDAYETLDDQFSHLKQYPVVTKSRFRAALKAYEAMLQNEFKYESWRVGSLGTDWINLNVVDTESGWWGYSGQKYAYGTLYAHLQSAEATIREKYDTMDEIKSLNKTSDPDIVKACFAAENAVTVMNDWKADDTTRGSKSAVQKLLNTYHGRLVHDYATTAAQNLFDMVLAQDSAVKVETDFDGVTKYVEVTTANPEIWVVSKGDVLIDADNDGHGTYKTKLISAEINVKPSKDLYLVLDENGYATAVTTSKPSGKYKKLTKNAAVDLSTYVAVNASDITSDADNAKYNNVLDGNDEFGWVACEVGHDHPGGDGTPVCDRDGKWGSVQNTSQITVPTYTTSQGKTVTTVAKLDEAMQLAADYLSGDKDVIAASDIYTIDTTDSIADGTAKASSAEWTLVYRYLKYALSDKYDADSTSHTKAEVVALVEKSYELAEKTGDAALFAYYHQNLVDARKLANEWVKAANKDKKYKDNETKINNLYATDMYNVLNGYYTKLEEMYNRYAVSFSDVYNKIADTKAAIDEGELKATDELLAALEKTAYALSTVGSYEEEYDVENDAFTSDRVFQGFNRLNTVNEKFTLTVAANDNAVILDKDNSAVTASHVDLYDAYTALDAEVKKQTNPDALLGDVNGDGVVNALDASAILKAVVDGTVIDVKVGDYNADGAVNALDAAAILKFVVSQG